MKNFYVFEELTGKIIRKGTCSDDLVAAQAGTSEKSFEGDVDFDLYYVNVSTWPYTLTAKASCPATISSTTIIADGIDTILIDNIPIETTATIVVPEGAASINPIIINDGDLDFTCVVTGTYTFTLTSISYLSKTFTLTAI